MEKATTWATYYVTKYWATRGIERTRGGTFAVTATDGLRSYVYLGATMCRIGTEAFETMDAAIADVRKKAARKAERLRAEAIRCESIARDVSARTAPLSVSEKSDAS